MMSRGDSNTRWRAMASSTTPRLGPRCPLPVAATERTIVSRISSASCSSWLKSSARRSSGPAMVSRSIPTTVAVPCSEIAGGDEPGEGGELVPGLVGDRCVGEGGGGGGGQLVDRLLHRGPRAGRREHVEQ